MKTPTNAQIADVLERISDLLELQDANPFRVRAYNAGAGTVRNLEQNVADYIKEERWDDLKALPNIGEGIAAIIGEYVSTGKSNLLQDLESRATPEAAFIQVPGIGKELAKRVVNSLQIKSLAELEEAAHDGRLETVEGFGRQKVEGVRHALAGMLNTSSRATQRSQPTSKQQQDADKPSVSLLLSIDKEYRERAQKNELHKIAPRRFNPENREWLPVMHTKREGWSFTVLFSNTARAHELEKTDDWVVIYYEKDGKEQQNTVVTETQGPLKGKRVVRGRSTENQAFYKEPALA